MRSEFAQFVAGEQGMHRILVTFMACMLLITGVQAGLLDADAAVLARINAAGSKAK